jgi:AcrR family transcriptional regulator
MEVHFSFDINPLLFKKNPEESAIGRQIVGNSIELIYELGIENFTFKKLASKIQHTEATIYRYFENKQMLLLYLVNWYWHYLDVLIDFKLQNLTDPKQKLEEVIAVLSQSLKNTQLTSYYNLEAMFHIVIKEGNKVYLNSNVKEINKIQVYKPFKDLCEKLSLLFREYNPDYEFPRSLASTLIEVSHLQIFFSDNLPKLTDVNPSNKYNYIQRFLTTLIFKSLK